MNRLFLAVILSLTVCGSAFANPKGGDETLNFPGSEHFARQFPQATAVNYKVKAQFTEVDFTWNGLQLQAFYDNQGTPLATARTIDKNNLPVNVQLNLQKNYGDAYISAAIEYADANDGLCYYVTVLEPKASYLLHVSTSGDISVFKKMKH
jgi:hypothetical protein